jgi:hypothetical protein
MHLSSKSALESPSPHLVFAGLSHVVSRREALRAIICAVIKYVTADWPMIIRDLHTSATSFPKALRLCARRPPPANNPKVLCVMSRRRGVVRSDDENAAPTQPRRSTATARPSGRSTKQQRQTEQFDPAVLELPNLAFLTNEHAEAVRAPLMLQNRLAELVANAMSVISDTAVAVEDVSDENSEVARVHVRS